MWSGDIPSAEGPHAMWGVLSGELLRRGKPACRGTALCTIAIMSMIEDMPRASKPFANDSSIMWTYVSIILDLCTSWHACNSRYCTMLSQSDILTEFRIRYVLSTRRRGGRAHHRCLAARILHPALSARCPSQYALTSRLCQM